MKAYLLTIGDEILIGQITDTNSSWMGKALNLEGISVIGKATVADSAEDIIDGVHHGLKKADFVIATGGLGPTKDDVTKKTLAEFFETELVHDVEVYERISSYYHKVGRKVSEAVKMQAMQPSDATILPNGVGTASGMWFEKDGKVVISLPGVPYEMQHLMEEEVIPRLKKRLGARPIVHRTLRTVGEGESTIAKMLDQFEDQLPAHIKLAFLPSLGQVRLRLTGVLERQLDSESVAGLERELDEHLNKMHSILGELIYGKEDELLEAVVGRMLLERGKTLGTAESCTGGYIAHLITRNPGSSAYYPGTVVSYSYELKTKLLGVKEDTLQNHGAVSEETVIEMAKGALGHLDVDIALAVSGIAGPGGGTPEKPVGTVWMAVTDGDRTLTEKVLFGRDRLKNIQLTGVFALNLVRKFLLHQ